MSAIKDGGPAFPGGERWRTTDLAGCVTSHSRAPFQPGLSLRDYFACQALCIGWNDAVADNDASDEYVARRAYEIADAMLAARETQP